MTELIKSPLFEEIRNYLKTADPEKQIFLYVPYIKTKTLSKLVDGIKNVTIITTWHMRDLVLGSSEVELYQFCKDHNYTLYVNNKIHLKVYSIALDSAIVASGNISQGGLEGGNYECGVLVKELSVSDRTFLEEIKSNAILIDEDQYQRHFALVEEKLKEKSEATEYDDLITDTEREYFLRSELPMTRNVNDLIKGYENKKSRLDYSEDKETDACIKHDLKTYQIESNLSQAELMKKLKLRFFAHPFTKKIDELIEEGAYWGAVRRWVRDHCKDVPLPRLWDLTENTQILYRWFVELGDGEYVVDVPGARSERISKILTYENEVLQILESPGYTIQKVKEIYQNLPNLSIHDEPLDPSENDNSSEPVWHYKYEMDEKVAEMLSLSPEEIGEKNATGKLYKKIAAVIGKLNNNGLIKMWYYKETNGAAYSDGVWRLTEEGKREIQRRGIEKLVN